MSKLKIFFYIIVLGLLSYVGFRVVDAYGCPDADSDGLTDCEEVRIYYTERYDEDTDNDGFLDGEEIDNKFSPHVGNGALLTDVDSDGDGLSDGEEIQLGTNIILRDSDGDGVDDKTQNDAGTLDGRGVIQTMRDKFITQDKSND